MSGAFAPQTSAVLPGVFTVATLPPPSLNQARYAFVTDLGGGPDMAISDGTNWKHIRRGLATSIPVSSTVTLTPLTSPTIVQFTGTSFSTTGNINLLPTNLYGGYEFTLVTPAGLFTALGSLGIGLNGIPISGLPAVAGIAGTWADYQFNGTTIVKLRGGSL